MRRTGIWMSVVGALLTLVGGITVLVTRDGTVSPSKPSDSKQAASVSESGSTGGGPATTILNRPAANRPPGTIAPGARPGGPASPTSPPPATPEEVAALLAGLPLQLEQAATSGDRPRELTPEEVDKAVEDMLRQLGAKP